MIWFGGLAVALSLLCVATLRDAKRFGRGSCVAFLGAWLALLPVGFLRASIQGYPEATEVAAYASLAYALTVAVTLGHPALLLSAAGFDFAPSPPLNHREQLIVRYAPWLIVAAALGALAAIAF